MTREVKIGAQSVKLRATGTLPLAYRMMFNRDLLQDMDKWREELRVRMEQAEAADAEKASGEAAPTLPETSGQADPAAPVEASGEAGPAAVEASEQTEADAVETPSNSSNEILYSMDLALIARLGYAMAKSADPSIPGSMTEWLDTLESPNALYILTGEVLQLYNSGFETTVEAKKNIPPLPAP